MAILPGRKFIITIAVFGCILAAGCIITSEMQPPLLQEPVRPALAAEQKQEQVAEQQPEPTAPVAPAEQNQEPAAEKEPEPAALASPPRSAEQPPQQASVPGQPVQRVEAPPQPAPPSAPAGKSEAPIARRKTAGEPAVKLNKEQDVISIRPGKYKSAAEKNDDRLLQVYVGMSKATVVKIMGRRGSYKREFWRDSNKQNYEVLFYLTRVPRKGNAITERHLTPVLFRKDRVHAIGSYQLKKVRQSAKLAYAPAVASK